MGAQTRFLSPSEAARRLGVSVKALRVYERRCLLSPGRTASGWRVYGPDEMARAAEIVSLRTLGFSLAQAAVLLSGDRERSEPVLATHQAKLESRMRQLAEAIEKVRELRFGADAAVARPAAAFALPWPWGGERFVLDEVKPLNYLIGPLGSGKTILARRLAEALPGAVFVGLDRTATISQLGPCARRTLGKLLKRGATRSDALLALLAALEQKGPDILVVDLIEQGLDWRTQEVLIAYLRERPAGARPIFLMTRSRAILDLASVGEGEAIILCPANHSPPIVVAPFPGATGYEAVDTCLAWPDVRARTEGMVAWLPKVA